MQILFEKTEKQNKLSPIYLNTGDHSKIENISSPNTPSARGTCKLLNGSRAFQVNTVHIEQGEVAAGMRQ